MRVAQGIRLSDEEKKELKRLFKAPKWYIKNRSRRRLHSTVPTDQCASASSPTDSLLY